MRRSLLTALLILLAAGVMASGDVPLEDAKRAVATADKKVVTTSSALQTLAKSLAQHLTALADVSRQLDVIRERQKQSAPIIAKAIEVVNAGVAAARSEAAAAQRALHDAESAAAAARADVGPKRAAIERVAAAERATFENSDEFRQASARVAAGDAALAKERARLDATMKADATIAPLLAAASKAETDVSAARAKSPADDAAIAEASAHWIEAKNALSAAQADRYAGDASFAAAQKAANAALATRTALSDAFDKSILGQPGVAEAQMALRDAQSAVKLADANVAAARDAVERAGRWLASQRANADMIARIASDADEGLAQAQADLKRAQDTARGIGQDVTTTATAVLGVRDDLKDATTALAAAQKK